MVDKKVVWIIVIVAILLVAGYVFGWFGNEPLLSPFDTTVSVAGAPPTIITTYLVIDTDGTGTATDIVTSLNGDAADNVNNAEIRFLAEDTNGIEDLPGSVTNPFVESTASGQLGTGGVNIEVYATNPGTDYAAVNIILDPGSCGRLPTCPDAGGSCPANQMEFNCTVPMDYFFEPGTIGTNPYVMTVGIADGSAATATGTRPFTYLANAYYAIAGSGLSWAGISLSSTDQVPAGSLDLTNYGNVDFVTSSTIHGSDLGPDGGGTGSNMPVSSFAISVQTGGVPLAECDGASHPSGIPVTADELSFVAPVAITAGGASSLIYGDGLGGAPLIPGENLYFCIWEQLDTLGLTFSESQYSSTVAKGTTPGAVGNAWDLALT